MAWQVNTEKKAYKKLALKMHPDKNPGPAAVDQFQKITTSCECPPDDLHVTQSWLRELLPAPPIRRFAHWRRIYDDITIEEISTHACLN